MNMGAITRRFAVPEVLKGRRGRIIMGSALAGLIIVGLGIFYGVRTIRQVLEAPQPSSLLLSSIQNQQQTLEKQKEALAAEQQALKQEREEYTKYLNDLYQLEDKLEEVILASQQDEEELKRKQAELERLRLKAAAKKDTVQLSNIKKMTKIYNSLRPAALANIIRQLREDLALQILLRMEERRVARLFAALEPGYAARLSEKLNKIKKSEMP